MRWQARSLTMDRATDLQKIYYLLIISPLQIARRATGGREKSGIKFAAVAPLHGLGVSSRCSLLAVLTYRRVRADEANRRGIP